MQYIHWLNAQHFRPSCRLYAANVIAAANVRAYARFRRHFRNSILFMVLRCVNAPSEMDVCTASN